MQLWNFETKKLVHEFGGRALPSCIRANLHPARSVACQVNPTQCCSMQLQLPPSPPAPSTLSPGRHEGDLSHTTRKPLLSLLPSLLRRHGAPVRSLAMSPALDVAGVGLADGRLVLHNIKFDKVIASFMHDAAGGALYALRSAPPSVPRAYQYPRRGAGCLCPLKWEESERRLGLASLRVGMCLSGRHSSTAVAIRLFLIQGEKSKE